MWGETCCWAAILLDPVLISVVYIAVKIPRVQRLSQYLQGAMGPTFTNLFAYCCTSSSFVFGAKFATPRVALGPMCHLMCWLLSCGLWCFAVLADRWQVILGEFPGSCTQCPRRAHAVRTQCNNLAGVLNGKQWYYSNLHPPSILIDATDMPQH